MKPDMKVSFAGLELASPVIAASGTFGYGIEFEEIVALEKIGGFVTKGISMEPMAGNAPPRIIQTASGMLNAIGLQNVGVRTHLTGLAGETRSTINLLDRESGRETQITEAGPAVGPDSLNQFLFHFEDTIETGDLVVLSGGLPVGAPVDLYARMIRIAHAKGARCIVDASPVPLAAALAEKPELVKPNLDELSALYGKPVRQKAEIISAVRALGIPRAVVSMGAKGALLVTPDGAWHAAPVAIRPVNTVGSGDSLTAGIALAMHRKWNWKKALALGTACAASNAVRVEVGAVDPAEVESWAAGVKV